MGFPLWPNREAKGTGSKWWPDLWSLCLRKSRGHQHRSCPGGGAPTDLQSPMGFWERVHREEQAWRSWGTFITTMIMIVITKTFCGNNWDDLSYYRISFLSIIQLLKRGSRWPYVILYMGMSEQKLTYLPSTVLWKESLFGVRSGSFLDTPRFSELVSTWQFLESCLSKLQFPVP